MRCTHTLGYRGFYLSSAHKQKSWRTGGGGEHVHAVISFSLAKYLFFSQRIGVWTTDFYSRNKPNWASGQRINIVSVTLRFCWLIWTLSYEKYDLLVDLDFVKLRITQRNRNQSQKYFNTVAEEPRWTRLTKNLGRKSRGTVLWKLTTSARHRKTDFRVDFFV